MQETLSESHVKSHDRVAFLHNPWLNCFFFDISVLTVKRDRKTNAIYMPKELDKARVNWHQEISRCPKPKAKFPPLIYGGLPPPPLQTTPRGHLCIPYAKPCQAPPPRPPPRSLATIATSGESESITGCNSSETRPSGKAQPNLVMPTSTPPDICRASRTSYQSSLQHWTEAKRQYEGWLSQLIIAIGPASLIFQEFAHRPVFATVIQQLLCHMGPSTLDLYSRAIQATAIWLKHIGSDWSNFSLQSLVEVLHQEASKCDSQSIRLKPAVLLKGLRWLAKTALMEDLLSLLNNTLISSFLKGDGIPRDRKEAVPIPLIVLIRWEETIINPSTPSWLKLLLGGYLLACWASLRFADLQRTDVGSLNLATNSLRGVCRVTKTTRSGQPFAVLLAAFTGESPQTSWIYHWLPTVQEACKRLKFFTPDFIIPVMDNYDTPSFSSPLTYAAALKAIRWAVQTPWSTLTLSSSMAQNITLHSLKVTMLASAAQLRLPHRDRQIQGHRLGGSVQLYSRDDTSDSLWVQSQITQAVRQGWRPTRPQHRGAQTPMAEPPVTQQLQPLPRILEFPLLPSLSNFQIEMPVMETVEASGDTSSSDSSSSSSECSESDEETLGSPPNLEDIKRVFVQNGPAGCCHVAIPAPAETPKNRLFSFQECSWTPRCGASLRPSAKSIPWDSV